MNGSLCKDPTKVAVQMCMYACVCVFETERERYNKRAGMYRVNNVWVNGMCSVV